MFTNVRNFARYAIRSPEVYARLRKVTAPLMSRLFAHDLTALARIQGADKWGSHWYTPHYMTHFQIMRSKKLNILEIGVGGYDDPAEGGRSLRMWKYFFPRSQIFSIDIFDKSAIEERRIKIFQGSQNDPEFLVKVASEIGRMDIIIDDGSHVNEHVITSFNALFPLMPDGGIYVIEDLMSSYWPELGGDSYDLSKKGTSLNFLKERIDGLNYMEIARLEYEPSFFDKNIRHIHFYHNLVFIYKGPHDEKSNFVEQYRY